MADSKLIKSPLLNLVRGEDELIKLVDIQYDAGFRRIAGLCVQYSQSLVDRALLDPHITPEDLKNLMAEARLFQGIADLPEKARQICVKKS